MLDDILSSVTGLFDSVRGLLDEAVTTEEERMKLRRKLREIEVGFREKVLKLQGKRVEARRSIIEAAKEQPFWKSWRALVMIGIFVLATVHAFAPGVSYFTPEQLYSLLKWGLGGYIGVEGAMGITRNLAPAAAERERRRAEQERRRAAQHERVAAETHPPAPPPKRRSTSTRGSEKKRNVKKKSDPFGDRIPDRLKGPDGSFHPR